MRNLGESHGLSAPVLQRIGALIVYCNLVEAFAEKVLWILKGENVRGHVPSTEKYKASQTICKLDAIASGQEASVCSAIKLACGTARYLQEYRNCIAHGEVLSFGEGTRFVSSHTLWGELRPGKKDAMALINERFLDVAIDAAYTVFHTLLRIALEATGPSAGRPDAMGDTISSLTMVRNAMEDVCRSEALRFLHLNGNLGESESE